MTPEEHEKYIDQLERNSEDAMKSWEKEQKIARCIYPFLLLTAVATTAWLIYKMVEAIAP